MSHPVGVGTATHRFSWYEGYVEGACFPAFRRWVFDRVGLFDETMVRTEDDEHNYRIKLAGGKAYVSPRVRYEYYVRDTLGKLFQQYNQYGFWRIPVMRNTATDDGSAVGALVVLPHDTSAAGRRHRAEATPGGCSPYRPLYFAALVAVAARPFPRSVSRRPASCRDARHDAHGLRLGDVIRVLRGGVYPFGIQQPDPCRSTVVRFAAALDACSLVRTRGLTNLPIHRRCDDS